MGRRSVKDLEIEESETRDILTVLEGENGAVTDEEKLATLLNSGIGQSVISKVLGMLPSKIKRAKRSLMAGRLVGVDGRPSYLTAAQETELEKWCITENAAGRGPPITNVVDKVCCRYLPFTRCFLHFLTLVVA